MLNYSHKTDNSDKMTEKIEEDTQKLEALFKVLKEEKELNNKNLLLNDKRT